MTPEEREALEDLKKKTDAFIGEVFDWVSTLGQQSLLGRLYEFNNAIEGRLNDVRNTDAG